MTAPGPLSKHLIVRTQIPRRTVFYFLTLVFFESRQQLLAIIISDFSFLYCTDVLLWYIKLFVANAWLRSVVSQTWCWTQSDLVALSVHVWTACKYGGCPPWHSDRTFLHFARGCSICRMPHGPQHRMCDAHPQQYPVSFSISLHSLNVAQCVPKFLPTLCNVFSPFRQWHPVCSPILHSTLHNVSSHCPKHCHVCFRNSSNTTQFAPPSLLPQSQPCCPVCCSFPPQHCPVCSPAQQYPAGAQKTVHLILCQVSFAAPERRLHTVPAALGPAPLPVPPSPVLSLHLACGRGWVHHFWPMLAHNR